MRVSITIGRYWKTTAMKIHSFLSGQKYLSSPARRIVSAFMLFAALGIMTPAVALETIPTNLTFTVIYGDTNAIPTQNYALTVPADVSATAYFLATTNSWIVTLTNSEGEVSGTIPSGGTTNITVAVLTDGLAVGNYIGIISNNMPGETGWTNVTVNLNILQAAVEGDFDGDRLADPFWPIKSNVLGMWTFWLSSGGYLPSGPYEMTVSGGEPVGVADFDGDGLADPAMVANGGWTLFLSSGGYLPSGPYVMSVPGGEPVVGDFDGDRLADPAMVANGGWTFWFSSGGYVPSGPYVMSVSGTDVMPMTGDFDGDGLADPAMVADNNWTFWFSSGGYLPSGPYSFVP